MEFAYGPARQLEGFLRLSLVTRPVALYLATSDSEKISFNQIGIRVIGSNTSRSMPTSAKRWASEDIMKGYKVDTDSCIEVTKDELENIALD